MHLEDKRDGGIRDTSGYFLGSSSIDSVSNGVFSPQTEVETITSHSESIRPKDDRYFKSVRKNKCFDSSSTKPAQTTASPPGWIAFGTLRLRNVSLDTDQPQWHVYHGQKFEEYPSPSLKHAVHRGCIHTEFYHHPTNSKLAYVRVYVCPEDVNRTGRASIKEARKAVKLLLPFIDTSDTTRNGDLDLDAPSQQCPTDAASQQESLFYIFNTLASPTPSLDGFNGSRYAEDAMINVLQDEIAGLTTQLYPYQKRSVAAMLRRESDPAKSLDPRKIEFKDITGKQFYLDVIEGSLLQHPPLYTEPQGGILAETMGYGKTLICLALVLATRGHYPSWPEGRVDNQMIISDDKTPSLFAMSARALRYHAIPWKAEFHAMAEAGDNCEGFLEEIEKYEREYAEPIFNPNTPDRKANKRESSRILRLCSATLVVVPPNLLVQWQQEIEKHTKSSALDVLVIDASTSVVPHWRALMKYDLILITKARFEAEYRDDDMNQGKRYKGQEKFHSPLTDLRWLRVICDEGHGFAGSSSRTNAMAMLDKMSIERRWVVSGTPSSTLHGVEVDLASVETIRSSRKETLSLALETRRQPHGPAQEFKDMERLRLIVVNFLKLQPWANQKGSDYADWKKYLVPLDAAGKRRFAPGLRTLLQSLIIRHRIEDIDLDLSLPPLYNKTVYLKPSYYDKLSMNMFVLVLSSNAVTSERTDEDYMHHIKNRKRLDELIKNLRQSSFHWVGFTERMVMDTLRVSNAYLDSKIDTISDQDGALLTEAIMNGERALADLGWKAFSCLHEIGVYVTEFPEHAASAWAIHEQNVQPLLLGTVQAREAQDFVYKHMYEVDSTSGLNGAGLRAMRAARERALEEQNEASKSKATSATEAAAEDEPKVRLHASPARGSISDRREAGRKRTFSQTSMLNTSLHTADSPLPVLPATKIVGFSSSKLSYLVSQVVQYSDAEKIIIFYDTNNIAFWVAEALELIGLKFLIYANTLSVARRATYLATFNVSPKFRVLLMDLKQAAHGLHIACASRVYIISPIWQPNIESQAIKRAHRIGQTKPVYVETLVLEGTIEDRMWKRRKQMSSGELKKAEKSLLDDSMMAKIIKEEGFLKFDDDYDANDTTNMLFNNDDSLDPSPSSSPTPHRSLLAQSRSMLREQTKPADEWHKVALLPHPIPLFTIPHTDSDNDPSTTLYPQTQKTTKSGTATPSSRLITDSHPMNDLILAIGDVARPDSRTQMRPKKRVRVEIDGIGDD